MIVLELDETMLRHCLAPCNMVASSSQSGQRRAEDMASVSTHKDEDIKRPSVLVFIRSTQNPKTQKL